MKDLYGKTYGDYRLSRLRSGIIMHLGSLCSDVCNLKGALVKRPIVIPAFLAFLCSLACYCFSSFLPSVIFCLPVMAAGVYFGFLSKGKRAGGIAFLMVSFMLCTMMLYIGFFISNRLNAAYDDNSLKCVVTKTSRDLSGGLDMTVRLDGGAYAKVSFYCDHEDFDPGDVLILYGKIKEPGKAGNPGEFDYREYLRKQGILYTVSCNRYRVVKPAGFPMNAIGYLQRLFFRLRKSVFETVTASFDDGFKALAAAVCIGDRSLISDATERDFKMSCCSHLLAVSGTHFSGFLLCLPLVLNVLNVKPKKAFLAHVVFCIFIGCLTGWSDSVTRAAVMSICVFADREWVSALSLASIIMIIADPFCALSSGFQMSFCAVVAIKVYGRKIGEVLEKFYVPEYLAKTVSPAVAAGLGLIPFWSDISMRPDPEHLLIQILGSLIAGCACTFFVPCVILCRLLPFWTQHLSAPLLCCLDVLYRLVSFGRSLSEQSGPSIHLGRLLLVMLGVCIFLYMMPASMFRRMLIRPVAFVLAVLIGFESFSYIRKPECRVVFADVGQGDCCLVITPDKTCLIDAGTYKEGSTTVSDLLDYYGISRIDICVMSHWDVDHAGGIAALCEQGRTGCILTSYVPSRGDSDKDVREFFESVSQDSDFESLFLSQLSPARAGDRIVLSDSVFFDVLYPSSGTSGGNESSLVMMLHVTGSEDTSILFTGDIGSDTESVLISAGLDLDCDILKTAHHGSKYSSSAEFISACSPDIAVISVGAGNLYGHPSPETLKRLETYGCDVFRTDMEGAVVLEY